MKIAGRDININWKNIAKRVALMVVAALVLTFFLEYRYFMNDISKAIAFVWGKPLVFLYTSLIMFFIVMFFTGLIGKPFMGVGLTMVTIMIISYIHINKFALRGSPLIPEDFQFAGQAGTLTKFVDIWGIVRLVIAIVLIIIAAWLLDKNSTKIFHKKGLVNKTSEMSPDDRLIDKESDTHQENADADKLSNMLKKENLASKETDTYQEKCVASSNQQSWMHRYQIGMRAVMIILAIVGFMVSTDFIRNHTGKRSEEISWLQTQFLAWDQVWNYDNNGFLIGFLYNWNKYEIPQPEGYSEEKVAEIHEELIREQEADQHPALSTKDYNIIVVLEESFYDPSIIKDIYNYTGGDVTPELHKIQAKYPSGQMYSLDYGGGTANMEFEVLTGLSNFWANTVPYSNVLSRAKAVPSIASFAKEQGYQTMTIHSFNGGMYKRDLVLPKEGFDEFMTELEMDYTEKDGHSSYINDRSAFQQTLKELRERDGKQMISLLTMQNHAPYNIGNYDEYDFKVTNIDNEAERQAVEVYLQTVHNSDKYLGEFIEVLDAFDEPTVVLLYGDHSPGVFTRVNESADTDIRERSRLTPYFVYANFDLKTSDLDLPTTTPNCLTNTMFNILKVQKPEVEYLVDEVCKEQPILTQHFFGEKELKMTDALRDYEYISYSVLAN